MAMLNAGRKIGLLGDSPKVDQVDSADFGGQMQKRRKTSGSLQHRRSISLVKIILTLVVCHGVSKKFPSNPALNLKNED